MSMLYTTCILSAAPRKCKYAYQSSSPLSPPLLFLNPLRIPLFPLLLSLSSSESSPSEPGRDPCCLCVKIEADTLVANVRSVGRTPVCESRNSRALVVKLSDWPSSSKPINRSTALPSTYDITQGKTLTAIFVTKNGTLSTFARRKRVCLCLEASWDR